MSTGDSARHHSDPLDLLQGTLDLLVLRTLQHEPVHGYGIVRRIQEVSRGALCVDHGSLYPALQRLQRGGLIEGEWGLTANNRRARFYRLTRAGRRQLRSETDRWQRLSEAVARVLAEPEAI